mmetsp:Transcript_33696/g.24727  ORF Transcript_33696/g.24727 Transcript_33696/m.24727 type:complete len:120 (+) Transcript_33696:31-390(+)
MSQQVGEYCRFDTDCIGSCCYEEVCTAYSDNYCEYSVLRTEGEVCLYNFECASNCCGFDNSDTATCFTPEQDGCIQYMSWWGLTITVAGILIGFVIMGFIWSVIKRKMDWDKEADMHEK